MGEPITTLPEADEVARECPIRCIAYLHQRGVYTHYKSAFVSGRVHCIHKDAAMPQGCERSDAQKRLDEALAKRDAG